jgi:glycerol kinase
MTSNNLLMQLQADLVGITVGASLILITLRK